MSKLHHDVMCEVTDEAPSGAPQNLGALTIKTSSNLYQVCSEKEFSRRGSMVPPFLLKNMFPKLLPSHTCFEEASLGRPLFNVFVCGDQLS